MACNLQCSRAEHDDDNPSMEPAMTTHRTSIAAISLTYVSALLIIAGLGLSIGAGCGDDADSEVSGLGSTVGEGANSAVDTGRAAIEDKIDCSGIVREETRLLITDLIETAR